MSYLPCFQTPRVQRMLLVKNMELQKEWVQEKGMIYFLSSEN
ncbi:hypothetical protein MTR67_040684 [Solanum verrucosum]|uniref:Uncharacterized protein n=1 Tax=Solanum verrucosum TaxID=315347 RepID=A0AAF0ZSC7_SOLVR|nr:hypothetical protein MTR67_040684 [Solanum verrucosum]